ncbi:30S ribosomal protein S1 [Tetrabaena socialis]|uniref:30S ribosomal protein S1 n=1 Tax=Tetrabaena socialis TaxID=47790 RepID=A0A2J7ZV40_9CHLO|nr:30S ribosomal protein S1 [Tetrabaena socialis]|eukprot:PNH04144.1 30S ribosomal protein S1 [Tetrabaena socialis]
MKGQVGAAVAPQRNAVTALLSNLLARRRCLVSKAPRREGTVPALRKLLSVRPASANRAGEVLLTGDEAGHVVAGVVSSVTSFGAFIDLDGSRGIPEDILVTQQVPRRQIITGLLHIRQVSQERVEQLDGIFRRGDRVKVLVQSLDKDRGRVELSTKELEPVGHVVWGVIASLRANMASVDLEGGIIGTLHVSQVSQEHVERLEEVLKEGDEIKALVFGLDPDRAHVALSTGELEPAPGDMLRDPQLVYDKAEEEGHVVEGVVHSVRRNAAVIDLGNGVPGLLDASQVSSKRVKQMGEVLREGDRVKALILSKDPDSGRVALSTCDMLRDPQLVYGKAEEVAEQYRSTAEWKWWYGPNCPREDDVVDSVVLSFVKPAEAFIVDLGGGITGMLSKRQCSQMGPAKAFKDVFKQGDPIRALIREKDPQGGRVVLSTKELEPTSGRPGKACSRAG